MNDSRAKVFAVAGLKFPQRRVTANLAPSKVPKEGTGFDLTSRVPGTPRGHWLQQSPVWKIEEILALPG